MKIRGATLALLGAGLLLPGCVAAVVPVVAAGAIGGKKVLGEDARPNDKALQKAERRRLNNEDKRAAQAGPASDAPFVVPSTAPDTMRAPPPAPAASAVPGGMQYLYASGEAAAVSLQAYLQLMNHLLAVSSSGSVGHPVQSVVLAPGTTLAEGRFVPCGRKPLAMVLDVDETALLNAGFEGDQLASGGAYDQQRWLAWEQSAGAAQVQAVPGALGAVAVARNAGIAVIFNSNRSAAFAPQTAAMLATAGFGTVVHGDTLWLQGDGETAGTAGAGPGSGKDARRAAISARYCVIAMVGDQLGDFSDQFNAPGTSLAARRQLVASREVLTMWGHGWFILPNPVYGSGVKGDMDEVFPPAGRWSPPQENK